MVIDIKCMLFHGYEGGAKAYQCFKFKISDPNQKEMVFPSSETEYVFDTQTEWVTTAVSSEKTEIKSTAKELRGTVSNWYQILRDISLVALLSVLVYVGIRIVISSTSNDKAKYKQMIIDWVVAICLLFIMQYIMSFSNILVNKFIDLLDTTQVNVDETVKSGDEKDIEEPEVFVIEDKDKVKKAYETLIKEPLDNGKLASAESSPYYSYFVDKDGNAAGENATKLVWPAENFVQQARFKLQLLDEDGNDTYGAIGWKLIYVVLVIYTFIFIFTYLKRVVYMAFLTIIAPLVALTYPIDKISDGKAQAFNTWFKEYIFNLLIQPMHLILYTVLVTSAMDFASTNIFYVVVALGFIVPAEKLLRKFFGFSKAETPGLFGGPAGAALMMNGMNKLLGKGKGKDKEKLSGSKNGKADDFGADGKPPRIDSNFDKDAVLFGDGSDANNAKQNANNLDDINESLGIENDKNKFSSPYSNDELEEMNDYLGINNSGNNESRLQINNGSRNNINSNSIQRPKRSLRRAAAMAGRYYARGVRNNIRRGISNKANNLHPLKTAAKVATGLGGAAVAGSAALAVGITSGDVSKAVQYTAAGALGGYKLTSGIPDKVGSLSPGGVAEVADRAYYGSSDEYDKVQQEKYIREYQKDENNRLALEQKYGNKEAKRIMEKDVPTLIDNGITDMKDITAIEDMIKDSEVNINSVEEGIAAKKYASAIGEDTTKMTEKKRQEWRETFSSRFAKNEKYKGYDNDEMADTVIKKVDAFNKKRYK